MACVRNNVTVELEALTTAIAMTGYTTTVCFGDFVEEMFWWLNDDTGIDLLDEDGTYLLAQDG